MSGVGKAATGEVQRLMAWQTSNKTCTMAVLVRCRSAATVATGNTQLKISRSRLCVLRSRHAVAWQKSRLRPLCGAPAEHNCVFLAELGWVRLAPAAAQMRLYLADAPGAYRRAGAKSPDVTANGCRRDYWVE